MIAPPNTLDTRSRRLRFPEEREVVLIDTEAHKAIDVFYVTSGGGKLTAELQAKLGEDLRAVCQPKS